MSPYISRGGEMTGEHDRAFKSILRRYILISGTIATADIIFGAVFVVTLLDVGLTPTTLGLALGLVSLVSLISEAPSGALGDAYGHKRMLVVGLTIWGIGLLTLGISNSVILALIALCLWTVGMSFQSGTLAPIVFTTIPSDADQKPYIARGVRTGQVSRWTGSALGGSLLLTMGDKYSNLTLIAFSGLALICTALLALTALPETPRTEGQTWISAIKEATKLTKSKQYLPLVLASVIFSATLTALVVAWQPLISQVYGASPRFNGLILIAMMATTGIGAWLAKFIPPEKYGSSSLLILLCTSLCLPLAAIHHPLAWILAAELFVGMAGVQIGTWQYSLFPEHLRNSLYSTVGTLSGLGAAAMNLGFGALWDKRGLEIALFASGTLATASVITLHLYLTFQGRKTHVTTD